MRASDFAYFDTPTPIGLAHRGGSKVAANLHLENTLAAFRHAVDLGYHYLETDVHATSDGQLLAFHDHVLDRVTEGRGAIADLPYAVVSTARVNGTEPIPLLSDLLEEFPDVRLNIDVKAMGAIEPLAAVIRAHDAFDRVCVASFSRTRLRAVRALLGPTVATAAGPSEVGVLRFAPSLVADWLRSPAPVLQIPTGRVVGGRRLELVTPALVERVHAMGKHVHVWTIDEPEEIRLLLARGVDGLVTDRTDVLKAVLLEDGRWRGSTP